MKHYYSVFQNGNFTDDFFCVGPVMEAGIVTKICGGARTMAGGTTTVANVTCLNANGSVALTAADLALGGDGPTSGVAEKATLHATPANLVVAEGDMFSIEFDDAAAGNGALPVDTSVCIEVTSEN